MEQGEKLTDKQEEKLGTWASNAAKKRESDIDSTSKAKLEADKKAWQEYFIEFGNYQEKRKNLIQKYKEVCHRLCGVTELFIKLFKSLVLDTFKIKFFTHKKTVLAKLILFLFALLTQFKLQPLKSYYYNL